MNGGSTPVGAVNRPINDKLSEMVSVKDFGAVGDGATNDYAAFASAVASLPSTGGVIYVPDSTGYLINTQIDCNKPILWKIGNTTITGPSAGSLFNFQVNNSGIEGSSNTVLKATQGSTSIIHNNQTLNCHYWDLILDMNNCTNLIGLYHDGGWYIDVKNIYIDLANEVSTSYSFKIQSTIISGPGSTGSYGGAFVGTYSNVIGGKLWIQGDTSGAGYQVTTMTFTTCSVSNVIINLAAILSFIQPVVQITANNQKFFDLTNCGGVTLIGGDYESQGHTGCIVYNCNVGVSGIQSLNNQLAAFIGTQATYIVGRPVESYFDDVGGTWEGYDSPIRIGTQPTNIYTDTTGTTNSRIGIQPINSDACVMSVNMRMTTTTSATLDDITKNGLAVVADTSEQLTVYFASAGTNPRTPIRLALINGSGLALPTLISSAPAGGSKQLWYDPSDGNRVKFVP